MSADNGIYVLLTETEAGPEYRVAYANAIGNIFGKFNGETCRFEGDIPNIQSVFSEAPVFHTLNEALDHAEVMESEYEFLEDGVCVINEFKDLSFIFK
jgi:hypothetical protein